MTYRVGESATVLPDGRVLVVGGASAAHPGKGDPDAPSALWVPDSALWLRCPGPRHPRAHHVAVALSDGRLMVLGGIEAIAAPNGPPELAVLPPEIFDPRTLRWSPATSPGTLTHVHNAVCLASGAVLAMGAHVGDSEWWRRGAAYDPTTDRWSDVGPITRVLSSSLAQLGTGDALTAGGFLPEFEPPARVWPRVFGEAAVYRASTGAWTAVKSMRQPRAEHLTLALPDGRAIVIGGMAQAEHLDAIRQSGEIPLASTEVFDPATELWADGPNLLTARTPATGAVLADGRLLVVGTHDVVGVSSPHRRGCAEILDLEAGTSTPIAEPLADPLSSLVGLPDGRAFAYGAMGDPSTEVFDPATGVWTALPPPEPPAFEPPSRTD